MWHFSKIDKKLGYGDDRIIRAGRKLKIKGQVVLCWHGLHASACVVDALIYAPGPYIWNVELGGEVIHGKDKSVGSERKALWGYDATDVLKSFSRRVALDSINKFWNEKTLGEFPKIVKDWLATGNEEIRESAARSADLAHSSAASAAESAAAWAAQSAADSADSPQSAAESAAAWAAQSAAESAAYSADLAYSAAESAAESAASWAAQSAAESAARSEQNQWLEEMIVAGRP